MLYAFFWVIPRHLNFIRRRFGTLCLFHLQRQVGMKHTTFRTRRKFEIKKLTYVCVTKISSILYPAMCCSVYCVGECKGNL